MLSNMLNDLAEAMRALDGKKKGRCILFRLQESWRSGLRGSNSMNLLSNGHSEIIQLCCNCGYRRQLLFEAEAVLAHALASEQAVE